MSGYKYAERNPKSLPWELEPNSKLSPVINRKNLPKKSQKRFYNFLMLDVLPRVLITFKDMLGQDKYFWDKPGFDKWYARQIGVEWEKCDYIKVIIMATIALFQKEKLK